MNTTQFQVTVRIDDRELGVFDGWEGGAIESEELKVRPGAMGRQEARTGLRSRTNLTLTREYILERDHPLYPWLESRAGRGVVTAGKQPLDTDQNPFGEPKVVTGILLNVMDPDHDSESSGKGLLILVVSTNE